MAQKFGVHGHIADGGGPENAPRTLSVLVSGLGPGQKERAVKPSAQPTLVRTQHLPPPAKLPPDQRLCGQGRSSLVRLYAADGGRVRAPVPNACRSLLGSQRGPLHDREAEVASRGSSHGGWPHVAAPTGEIRMLLFLRDVFDRWWKWIVALAVVLGAYLGAAAEHGGAARRPQPSSRQEAGGVPEKWSSLAPAAVPQRDRHTLWPQTQRLRTRFRAW
jgi:hypothetical protein